MKYTPQKARAIAKLVEGGLSLSRASVVLGMNKDTAVDWKQRYPEFSQMIEAAEGRFIQRMIDQIATHAKTDWRAAMELLARRFPSEFSKDRTEPPPPTAETPWDFQQAFRDPTARDTFLIYAQVCERINEAERQGKKWRFDGMAVVVE